MTSISVTHEGLTFWQGWEAVYCLPVARFPWLIGLLAAQIEAAE